MKNIIKSFAALAVSLLAFNACQNELAPVEPVKSTHKVSFVADSPATKTSYETNDGFVDYSWSSTDQTDHSTGDGKRAEKFQVFENGIAATSIDAVLVDDKMVIEAEFVDTGAESFKYQALFNAGVRANQSSMDESYDQDSDVLISNILTDKNNLVFSFKREVAMATVTLKGLEKGASLLNVKIESDKPLAGTYNKDTHEWENTSTTLSIDSYNEIAAGVVALRFITIPVEDAMLKVTVQTTDDLDNVAATYVKEFTKPISFARGDVRPFNANLEGCETLPEVEHTISWSDYTAWEGCTLNGASVQGSETISLKTMPYGYSVVLAKDASGSNNPTVNKDANDCRQYAKGTVKISNNKFITKVVFNISTQGKKRLAPITASVGTIATQASGDETVVWTGKAKEITFTVGEKADYGSDGSSKAGQLCFDSIDATYLDDGTPDPEPEEPTEYNISIDGDITGGTVSADKEKAVAGAQVTVSYEASPNYEFAAWNVTDESSNIITVTDGKFTMPASNVTVSATFNKLPDPGEQPTTVKFDNLGYESWGKESSFSGSTYDELSQTKDNVTFTYTRGDGSTYANQSAMRFYKDNELKFDAPSGYLITSIEWEGSSWKDDVTTNVETCTSSTSALSWSGSASSVTFTRPSTATSYATLTAVTVKLAKDVALTSIVVSGTPSKKTYLAGESFETAGLTATGKYEDNSEADLTSKVDWKVTPSTLTTGLTSVKVVASLGEVDSEEFTVNGLTVTEPATLTSISVKTAPTKVEYTEGDNFDPAGLVITRHYSDGTNNDYTYAGHTEEFSFSPALNVALETSHTTVTITYGGQSANQSITVNEKQIPTYASLAELVAAGKPTTEGVNVNVTLTNEEITSIFTTAQGFKNGIFLKSGSQAVEIYCKDVPDTWAVGGTVSGTLSNCVWKLYGSTWELCPEDWSELNYAAPLEPCAKPVIEISDAGSATITCATNGAKIYYTIGDSPADPTSESTRYTGAVTMTDGQTIKAIAYKDGMKPSDVDSKKYTAGGGSDPRVYTYVFNSANWGATVSVDGGSATAGNWTGTAAGNQFNSSQSPLGVQVTTGKGSGATVTSPISFKNVTKVEVIYASSKNGVGTIAISVGGVAAGDAQSISKSQTETKLTFTPGSTKNGTVVLTPTVTTNSLGIRQVIVYAD